MKRGRGRGEEEERKREKRGKEEGKKGAGGKGVEWDRGRAEQVDSWHQKYSVERFDLTSFPMYHKWDQLDYITI